MILTPQSIELRDKFATAVIGNIFTDCQTKGNSYEDMAMIAYMIADQMLKARKVDVEVLKIPQIGERLC